MICFAFLWCFSSNCAASCVWSVESLPRNYKINNTDKNIKINNPSTMIFMKSQVSK
uniref:Uncharacterized protein n=1 Tax=Nelumbo nucifera TaxID=4432 RepID=A0A822XMT4_NELNU|nr:TPA_asm: hypothetical protein HUJ06_022825 [Nelumbo nucifera]